MRQTLWKLQNQIVKNFGRYLTSVWKHKTKPNDIDFNVLAEHLKKLNRNVPDDELVDIDINVNDIRNSRNGRDQ